MEHNSTKGNGIVTKMTAHAKGGSKKAEGMDKIDFFLVLDELSDDPQQCAEEITKAVLEAYKAENLAFQES